MNWATEISANLQSLLLSANFIYSPVYLLSTAVIALFIWVARGRQGNFIKFIVPRELYRHPSTRVDVKITLFNHLFIATGVFTALYVAPIVTYDTLEFLGYLTGATKSTVTTWSRGVLVAIILILTDDFCRFINHYWHHKNSILWPFHSVHHSAEVLTPITFFRAHPIYYSIQRLIISVLIGIVQGIVLFGVVGHIELWVIYATTLVFNVYFFLGAHLRHSHINLRYGHVLEHVLISPMQHQIHHSTDPSHFDRNFGEIFAIWDWMFGTLYIPRGNEKLTFGLADAKGRLLPQPHPTLWTALFEPFRESARMFRTPGVRPMAATIEAGDNADD